MVFIVHHPSLVSAGSLKGSYGRFTGLAPFLCHLLGMFMGEALGTLPAARAVFVFVFAGMELPDSDVSLMYS